VPSELELRSFLKKRLPDYMIPARYVVLDSLPLTSNGKVDRAALPPPGQRDEVRVGPLDGARDTLERQFVKIWEEILRIKPVGIREDFFELGGNSLLAIRMLARVEKELGHNISLGTLMLEATIERLAATVRNPHFFPPPQVFGIQPNGWRPPFFCVGAGPLFRSLAHGLGSDQPFLGLPLPNLDNLPKPYRMEDISAYCARTMREIQPHGPYFLGGWSDAGVMAYEIAQQLRQQGETVALVVLFDAENQSYRPEVSSPLESAGVRLVLFSQWLRLQFRTLANLRPRALTEYIRDRASFRLAWMRGKIWNVAYRVHLRSGWRFNHGLHNVEYVSALVARDYQPRQYDGRVLLFRRDQRPTGSYRDPQYGWGGLASRLEVHEVRGNHIDMFREPNVQAMADKLRACLLDAQDVCEATTAAGARS
jgi:thioesterase domain-containing protein/acyl carrier protein